MSFSGCFDFDGEYSYLLRAVDQASDVMNVLIQRRRNRVAATRRRERQMQRFSSINQARRILSFHACARGLFRGWRRVLRAENCQLLRERVFSACAMIVHL